MLCPVTQSNWGNLTVALCDIFKDVLAAFAAALSVLPHISPVAATWAHCDKCIFVLYFVCFIISRTIYKSIFKIANIVVSEWWSLQTYPYHIGFRGRIKSVFGRKKKQNPVVQSDAEALGCGPRETMWVNWPISSLESSMHSFLLVQGPPGVSLSI